MTTDGSIMAFTAGFGKTGTGDEATGGVNRA